MPCRTIDDKHRHIKCVLHQTKENEESNDAKPRNNAWMETLWLQKSWTARLETRHEPLLYENEVTNFYPMVSYKEKNLLKTYKMSNL